MRWHYQSKVLQVVSDKTKVQTQVSSAKSFEGHHLHRAFTPASSLNPLTAQPVKLWLLKYKQIWKKRTC